MTNQQPREQDKESLRDIHCLVVDDHYPTRDMVKAILRSAGFARIDLAENADSALSKMTDRRYGLVVCDWNMPGMKGIDLLRHVRKHIDEDVPFLMLTAEAYRANVKEAIRSGVSDYITKPFTAQTLTEKVLSLVK